MLGGTSALAPRVEADLLELGVTTRRLAGPTRLETAVSVAQATAPDATRAVLVRAFPTAGVEDPTQAFADALAAGALAASLRVPLLLTQPDVLSAPVETHLTASGVREVIVVGGSAASAAAARGAILVEARHPDTWADAFPAALLSAREDSPVVLSDGPALPNATATWLTGTGAPVTCLSLVTTPACDAAHLAIRQGSQTG